ncbi:IPTL-CTERM sorting domain-containing protein [Diaphorobacter sp. HDW4B]|uniref:IPTL-CTERM sorting domain-containing protein n=1 Tax=Diaphorobacter sp. HDW4B TaxID=2714925 RepID=UPI001409BEFB|nr:IPTL-CTERM sorting domain-containing protein [Diaphorobacter sp. HDW4B]QIL73712.1 IPTL-CTERM sorting domain-containing protein [Diaphorobacter sp. HDW4B]
MKNLEKWKHRVLTGVWLATLWSISLPAAVAQTTNPKVLVLTTDEGRPGESFIFQPSGPNTPATGPYYDLAAVAASNNVASAFGSAYVAGSPQVTYKSGILSIRKVKTSPTAPYSVLDKIATYTPLTSSNYSVTPTDRVRVLSAVGTTVNSVDGTTSGDEHVVYVPNSTELLDPENLASVFRPIGGGRYDLIIVASTYMKVTDDAYLALRKVMQDPELRPNAILYFIDGCCDKTAGGNRAYSTNVERFSNMILRAATPSSISPPIGVGRTFSGTNTMLANTAANFAGQPTVSTYATEFQSQLPSIIGGDYLALDNVPYNNILYRTQDNLITYTPVGLNPRSQAYGIFFPTAEVFNGQGTCLFAVTDISPFIGSSFTVNTNSSPRNIGQAFTKAALAGGACGGMASIAASPAASNVTLASPQATITLEVKNETLNAASNIDGSISAGRVSASLPAHLSLIGTPTTSCTDLNGAAISPVVTPGGGSAADAFEVSGIKVPFQQSCTITLPVGWTDTSDPATNACIKLAINRSELVITPGAASNTFTTAQGQTNNLAQSAVVCTSPEVQLSILTPPSATTYAPGDQVTYTVRVENLSETAPATDAIIQELIPAGATLVSVTPLGCSSPTSCTLAAKPSSGSAPYADFVVTFQVPANVSSLVLSPVISLPNGQGEVTLSNNSESIAISVTKKINVIARLDGGNNQFAAQTLSYELTNCTATPTPTVANLNFDSSTAVVAHSAPAGDSCGIQFASTPGPTPTSGGYMLASALPTITATEDAATGEQTLTAVWNAISPAIASVTGSIRGAPNTFPSMLIGQTLEYALTCKPAAAIPASGTLTVGPTGQLSITSQPLVPAGSSCALTLQSDASALPVPHGYEWKGPTSITQNGNQFVLTLTMGPVSTSDAVPVPTLKQWALLLMSILLAAVVARRLRQY